MDDELSYGEIMRTQRRAVVLKILLVAGVLLFVLAASVHKPLLGYVQGWQHGDHDLLGRSLWDPPDIPVDPGAIEGLDLHRVHADLIPSWFIALARQAPDSPGVQRATTALQSELAADPQLLALAMELHSLVAEDPWGHAERIFALTDAWNEHLTALRQPWHLESNVVDMGEGPFFYTKSYRVEADLQVPLEGLPTPLRVLRRVDETNVRESYLGMVVQGQEEALVMVDRVRELATDELWQLLDPSLDPELSGAEAAFAPHVRAELARALSPAHHGALKTTAHARFGLRSVAMAINLRQACGSTLAVQRVPWQGLDAADLDGLERMAHADIGRPCPSVTLDELDTLRSATRTIREQAGLEPALGALVAHAARGTAVHELRHVADTRVHGEGRVACDGCADLSVAALREASAYLASFAWSGAEYTALFQACSQTRGAHAAAVDWVGRKLGDACVQPGPDLAALAVVLERRRFGERGGITLPNEWPDALSMR